MKNWVFTLRTLSWRDMVTSNGAPAGKATPRGHRHHCHRLTDISESFRPVAPCLPHVLDHGSSPHSTASATPPLGEARHGSKQHHDASSMHPPAPSPTTKAASDRSRRRGGQREHHPPHRRPESLRTGGPTISRPPWPRGQREGQRHQLQPPPAPTHQPQPPLLRSTTPGAVVVVKRYRRRRAARAGRGRRPLAVTAPPPTNARPSSACPRSGRGTTGSGPKPPVPARGSRADEASPGCCGDRARTEQSKRRREPRRRRDGEKPEKVVAAAARVGPLSRPSGGRRERVSFRSASLESN
jgi:hypothetical protein